jgi:hypothetical protein
VTVPSPRLPHTGAEAGSARHVVCAWATPRSVSTAFEKTFTRRTDTGIVHEPFTDCYYFGPARRSARYGESATAARADSASAIAAITSEPNATVFVKDLAFQAEPYLPDDLLESVTNTFLLRHPRLVFRSLVPLKPDFTEDEFGFTALHQLWTRVTRRMELPAVVVEGTEFRRSPERVLRRYCAQVGLAYQPGMLHWDDGRIRAWGPDEALSQAKWHTTLEASHTILPPGGDDDVDIPRERISMYRRALDIYDEVAASISEERTPDGPVVSR